LVEKSHHGLVPDVAEPVLCLKYLSEVSTDELLGQALNRINRPSKRMKFMSAKSEDHLTWTVFRYLQLARFDADFLSRAQGCLLGQIAGDALGSLVEFRRPENIRQQYPDDCVSLPAVAPITRLLGSPPDDSEMALMLARMLARSNPKGVSGDARGAQHDGLSLGVWHEKHTPAPSLGLGSFGKSDEEKGG
jgi:ADP-ribosylglycohydrolase